MNKLQLYITTSQADFKTRVEINADSYVQSWVCDLRSAVSNVDYSHTEKSIFYMIKYIDTGIFIVVLRTIPKEAGHHVAAWIFIPFSLHIADKDIADIVDFIADKIGGTEVTTKDIASMHETFAREYPEELISPIFPASEGLSYAYRYYGPRTGASLADLIGPYRYQTCYIPFAGVLLIHQDCTSDVVGTNLTSAPLEPMAVLLPPLTGVVEGYKPTIYDQTFDMPFFVPMSRSIDIVWQKSGFPEVKQPVYVAQAEMRAPALVLSQPNPLSSAPASQPHAAPEPKPQPAPAPALPADPEPDPAPAPSVHEGPAPERKKVYHFQIPAKSAAIGTVIEFEITTNANIADSPIDGYEATSDIQEGAGRSNHLLFVADNARKKWLTCLLFALGGFILGILFMLIISGTAPKKEAAPADEPVAAEAQTTQPEAPQPPKGGDSSQTSEAKKEEAPKAAADAQTPADRSLDAAIKYLDTNDVWNKADMESYPDLKGLYDDMNRIDRHKLVDTWGPKLKESRKFTNLIVHHSKLSYKKTAKRNPYNTPETTSIRVQAYLNTIDP